MRGFGLQGHARAHREAVRTVPHEGDLQKPIRGKLRPRIIAVDERFVVDIVHHEIRRAVAIQIAVRGPVGETWPVESPRRAHFGEREVAVVAERIVRQLGRRHGVDQARQIDPLLTAARRRQQRLIVRQKRDVVLRRDVLGQTVGHEDVLVAVEVEVGEQRGPAPVAARDAGLPREIAERAVAVVVLQHVAHELVIESLVRLGVIERPWLERLRRLEAVVVFGEHVAGVDIGPAVVVDVGDIHAHREVAGDGQRVLEHLAECPIAVVEVEVVALEEVVGDVDVRPAVAIHVRDGDPQSKPDRRPVNPRLLADVDEMAAVVPVQLVAT